MVYLVRRVERSKLGRERRLQASSPLLWAEALAHYLNGFGSAPDREIRSLVEKFLAGAPVREFRQHFNTVARRYPLRLRMGLLPAEVVRAAEQTRKSRAQTGPRIQYREPEVKEDVVLEPGTGGPGHADALHWLWLLVAEPDQRLRRCPICGTYFVAVRPRGQRFCGTPCKNRYWSRQRRRRAGHGPRHRG